MGTCVTRQDLGSEYGRPGFTFRMRYKRLRPHTSCAGYYKTVVARPSNIHVHTGATHLSEKALGGVHSGATHLSEKACMVIVNNAHLQRPTCDEQSKRRVARDER